MDDNKEPKRPRSRVKKGISLKNYITIAVILLFVTSFYLYLRMQSSISEPGTATSQRLATSSQGVENPTIPATSKESNRGTNEKAPLLSETEQTSELSKAGSVTAKPQVNANTVNPENYSVVHSTVEVPKWFACNERQNLFERTT